MINLDTESKYIHLEKDVVKYIDHNIDQLKDLRLDSKVEYIYKQVCDDEIIFFIIVQNMPYYAIIGHVVNDVFVITKFNAIVCWLHSTGNILAEIRQYYPSVKIDTVELPLY